MQPVRLVVAANDGAIPAFLVACLERRDLPADERLGRGGTEQLDALMLTSEPTFTPASVRRLC